MNWDAKWIIPSKDYGNVAPLFEKEFKLEGEVEKAVLSITCLGVYEAVLNGKRVGDFVLAPGWTSYHHRLQYQDYDVTELLAEGNLLTVTVGKGWYRSRMPGWMPSPSQAKLQANPAALLAQLFITYKDGSTQSVLTDESWKVTESNVRFSEIYDGEIYDASLTPEFTETATVFDGPLQHTDPSAR